MSASTHGTMPPEIPSDSSPQNRSVLWEQHGYVSARHDCVSGCRRVNVQSPHHANAHANGHRVRDRGHLRENGHDRVNDGGRGHHRVHVHRRAHDRGRLRENGRDRVHAHCRVRGHAGGRANDCAGVGADVHAQGCVRHHCNTASCSWQAATRQSQQSRYQKTDSTTERYRPVRTPVLRA